MVINLLNLFFPQVCLSCNSYLSDNEAQICTKCRHDLPLTNFHNDTSNAVHKLLYGRVKLEQATALLHFSKKGKVQQLMHNLKYRGQEVVGEVLGKWLGAELQTSQDYNSIDLVVPVPLHRSKKRKRGYNQVDKFAKALATSLNAEFRPDILQKRSATKTQVFKNRLRRSTTNRDSFFISKHQDVSHKHILLVDDIITTGATIEACAQSLLKQNNIKLSVATMAITD
ncbi:MAG: ComF family protein [Psychroserpens sp.]|nr:ComF family protein [Psychroserpens sp.]